MSVVLELSLPGDKAREGLCNSSNPTPPRGQTPQKLS